MMKMEEPGVGIKKRERFPEDYPLIGYNI